MEKYRKKAANTLETLFSSGLNVADKEKIKEFVDLVFEGVKNEIKQEEKQNWGNNIG